MADRLTIYEVARRSGVSTATVSRVMADGKGFSAATRERVRATAAELGWVPSGPGRAAQRNRRPAVPRPGPLRGAGGGVAAVRGPGDPRRGAGRDLRRSRDP